MSEDKLLSLIYNRGEPLKVLDQIKLPHEHTYIDVTTCQDGWNVINKMNVRGAPAIGLTGILSLSVELQLNPFYKKFETKKDLLQFLIERLDYLVTSRPTGVNLIREADILKGVAKCLETNPDLDVSGMMDAIVTHCEEAFEKDVASNKAMGQFGANHILAKVDANTKVSILTHCNTGSLATAGYGTALGVIRALHSMGKLDTAYCTETRPFNQGSRLTAYELVYEKIPATLVCDSAVSALMSLKNISAVIVGADRIAANGDTANKIGTLQLAIAAAHHGIPFYVAAPTTTIDLKTKTGKEIPIEDRSSDEITLCKCSLKSRIPPEGIRCWNPSFDVTPASLITGGIVTEFGVVTPPIESEENLKILGLD